jgi:hypothetical protein
MVTEARRRAKQRYNDRHREEINRRKRESYYRNKAAILARQRAYHSRNRDKILARNRGHYKNNDNGWRDKHIANSRRYRLTEEGRTQVKRWPRELRRRAMAVITAGGPLVCRNCSCDILDVLEIHHKNGDGRPDHPRLYSRIINSKRAVSDLGILCKICNFAEFIQRKFGLSGFNITYRDGREN